MADNPEYPAAITDFVLSGIQSVPTAERALQFPRQFVEMMNGVLNPDIVETHLKALVDPTIGIPPSPLVTLILLAHPSEDLSIHIAVAAHAPSLCALVTLAVAPAFDITANSADSIPVGTLNPNVIALVTDLATLALIRLSQISTPASPRVALATLAAVPAPPAPKSATSPLPYPAACPSALAALVSGLFARWAAPLAPTDAAGAAAVETSRTAAYMLVSSLARSNVGATAIASAQIPRRGSSSFVDFIDVVAAGVWHTRGLVMAHPAVSRGDAIGTPWQSLFNNRLIDVAFHWTEVAATALRTAAVAASARPTDAAATAARDAAVAALTTESGARARRRLLLVCVAVLDTIARCEKWPGATSLSAPATDLSHALTHEPIQSLLAAVAAVVDVAAACGGVAGGAGSEDPDAKDDPDAAFTAYDLAAAKADLSRWGVYELASRAGALAALGLPTTAAPAAAAPTGPLGLHWGWAAKRAEARLASAAVSDGGSLSLLAAPQRKPSSKADGATAPNVVVAESNDDAAAAAPPADAAQVGPFRRLLDAAPVDYQRGDPTAPPSQSVVLLPAAGVAVAQISAKASPTGNEDGPSSESVPVWFAAIIAYCEAVARASA